MGLVAWGLQPNKELHPLGLRVATSVTLCANPGAFGAGETLIFVMIHLPNGPYDPIAGHLFDELKDQVAPLERCAPIARSAAEAAHRISAGVL